MKKILKNKKGFTLMELIIVLVIVAVLAAALIPSFLNFVGRARDDSLHAQARVGLVAAQVLLTEGGQARAPGTYNEAAFETEVGADPGDFQLLVVDDVDDPTGFDDFIIDTGGLRVVGITYTDTNGSSVTIAP